MNKNKKIKTIKKEFQKNKIKRVKKRMPKKLKLKKIKKQNNSKIKNFKKLFRLEEKNICHKIEFEFFIL